MANNDDQRYTTPIFRLIRRSLLSLVFVMVSLAGVVSLPVMQARMQSLDTPTVQPEEISSPSETVSPTASPTTSPSPSTASPSSQTPMPPIFSPGSPLSEGTIILAVEENGYSKLFVYQPLSIQPFVRLTEGAWHDITPAISPDGRILAFASNRGGQWDLYAMDLSSGSISRLTDSPEYDAGPSFSPDGLWFAYESYDVESGGLEIYIRPIHNENEPIHLTSDPAADYAPAWSPQGRQIAFISNRSGNSEVWLADLDKVEDRFYNISNSAETEEDHPNWAQQGNSIAWTSLSNDGMKEILSRETFAETTAGNRLIGVGDWSVWSPDSSILLTAYNTPNGAYLTGYASDRGSLVLPPLALVGRIRGLAWSSVPSGEVLISAVRETAQITPPPLWLPALTPMADVAGGRQRLVPLEGIEAPYPLMDDLVDETFQALRQRTAQEIGWDFLSSLENAYVPITSPLPPGMGDDWLYTGRAFAFNPLPVNAGWVAVVREDYGAETYWRIFIRTRFQDGSQGEPLRAIPWNFSARYSGDPYYYELGGALADGIPSGYWVDFTELARAYGWERVPALNTWRSSFAAARFNEFVFSDGLDWRNAMLELYPPEALITPTRVVPTPAPPTRTPYPSRTPTPTRTPWPSRTPSPTP